jgi:hypothetical protein
MAKFNLNPKSGAAERSLFVERGPASGILHNLLEQLEALAVLICSFVIRTPSGAKRRSACLTLWIVGSCFLILPHTSPMIRWLL